MQKSGITSNMNESVSEPNKMGIGVDGAKELKDELTSEEPKDSKVEGEQRQKIKLSTEEQLKKLRGEVMILQKEIATLTESVGGVREELKETREKLGLPATKEEPPSVFLEKDRLGRLQSELDDLKEQEEKLELLSNRKMDGQVPMEAMEVAEGGGEKLNENDLIVSEIGIGPAKGILEQNGIRYSVRKYTKRQVIDVKTNTAVPSEFVLTILGSKNTDGPITFDSVKQVFELLKSSGIAVRYGKNPEFE